MRQIGESIDDRYTAVLCQFDDARMRFGSTYDEVRVLRQYVYEIGGHGFGMRPRAGAPGTRDWQLRASDWLRLRGFVTLN